MRSVFSSRQIRMAQSCRDCETVVTVPSTSSTSSWTTPVAVDAMEEALFASLSAFAISSLSSCKPALSAPSSSSIFAWSEALCLLTLCPSLSTPIPDFNRCSFSNGMPALPFEARSFINLAVASSDTSKANSPLEYAAISKAFSIPSLSSSYFSKTVFSLTVCTSACCFFTSLVCVECAFHKEVLTSFKQSWERCRKARNCLSTSTAPCEPVSSFATHAC
mmetsp:Transcript_42883/g.98375  ORF Transcript_42883/g.98375 Transcript_42883/m.98375 type:complete len:220 (-) Transcript_42883:678-1337(-)